MGVNGDIDYLLYPPFTDPLSLPLTILPVRVLDTGPGLNTLSQFWLF